MNRRHVTITTAFVLGFLAAFAIAKLATTPAAYAQAISPLAAARLNALEKRVTVLESQAAKNNQASSNGGQLHAGTASATDSAALGSAQINQVVQLQNQVNTLQAQLQKLQTELPSHYHTYTTTNTGSEHGILTILNCQGYGKPCTAATSENEITVFVPPNVAPGPPQTYTIQTSGPKTGSTN